MSHIDFPEGMPSSQIATNETAMCREAPFSLLWLRAVDPRVFTPYTWENGRETTIRLRAADGSIRVNVHRIISHYRADNEIELHDEAYALQPDETEVGNQDVSQFNYTFSAEAELIGFDPAIDLTESMQGMVRALSGLVAISGSTITASNYRVGQESNFVSDGTQWVEAQTGVVVPTHPAMNAGRLALDQPLPR